MRLKTADCRGIQGRGFQRMRLSVGANVGNQPGDDRTAVKSCIEISLFHIDKEIKAATVPLAYNFLFCPTGCLGGLNLQFLQGFIQQQGHSPIVLRLLQGPAAQDHAEQIRIGILRRKCRYPLRKDA